MNDALKNMVQGQLAPNGISDQSVLDAFLAVDRAPYLDEAHRAMAYADQNITDARGRLTMITPLATAHIIQHLAGQFQRGRVAIIGGGSGYEAAILKRLAFEPVQTNDEIAFHTGAPYNAVAIFGSVEQTPHYFLDYIIDRGCVCAIVRDENSPKGDIIAMTKDQSITPIAQAGTPFVRILKAPEAFSL